MFRCNYNRITECDITDTWTLFNCIYAIVQIYDGVFLTGQLGRELINSNGAGAFVYPIKYRSQIGTECCDVDDDD